MRPASFPGPNTERAKARARSGALMEPPWELELELRRHIETCACTCDHMGYGNYMDYHQVAPAAHACLCRAITSPHAHVRVVCRLPFARCINSHSRMICLSSYCLGHATYLPSNVMYLPFYSLLFYYLTYCYASLFFIKMISMPIHQ